MIEELKKIRQQGIDLGIKLNASTEILLERYRELKKIDKKDAPIEHRKATLDENLFGLVLSKLTVDTIFRLYQKSSMIRRLVERQTFWRSLIERDYGLVPKFPIDLKLYYLRRDGIRIAGSVWYEGGFHPKTTGEGIDGLKKIELGRVIYALDREIFLTRDGVAHFINHTGSPPRGERFREIFTYVSMKLLTYSGKIYDLDGSQRQLGEMEPKGIVQVETGNEDIRVLTREGNVYVRKRRVFLPVDLPEKVLAIFGPHILTEGGSVFYLSEGGALQKRERTIHWEFLDDPSNYDWLPKKSLPILSV